MKRRGVLGTAVLVIAAYLEFCGGGDGDIHPVAGGGVSEASGAFVHDHHDHGDDEGSRVQVFPWFISPSGIGWVP